MVYGMNPSPRRTHGSGTLSTRHYHARHSSRHTAIDGFDRCVEPTVRHQLQDRS